MGEDAMGEDAMEEDAMEEVEIAVVGSGFSGIGMAIRLKEMGVLDFVVLDRADDLGGTWRDNSYPGAACDVPSQLYSFSFALNPDWSRAYSPQAEIWEYLRGCVDRFGVAEYMRYRHEVLDVRWDQHRERWDLHTSQGALSARIVIWATGPLSEPKVPDLPGLSTFEGEVFHSARWDHGYDLSGKRVAVVGTGASAIQLVPRIAPRVAQLHLFQRTPPWILPRRDRPVAPVRRSLFRLVPLYQRLARARVYLRLEFLLGPAIIGRAERPRRRLTEFARAHLRNQVPDEGLRRVLTPEYEIGCKRVLVSDDFYPALSRPNVDVVPAAVAEVGPHSVTDVHGVSRDVDAIVLATGFEAAEPAFAGRIAGRDGVRLSEVWKDGVEAYLGTSVPGFPNLFLLVGPNTVLAHNSVVFMIESQLRYLAGAVRFLGRPGVGTVEVRSDVLHRYNERVQELLADSVWVVGGCGSWYLDHRGRNTTLWPGRTTTFRTLTRQFHPGDYQVAAPAPPVGQPSLGQPMWRSNHSRVRRQPSAAASAL